MPSNNTSFVACDSAGRRTRYHAINSAEPAAQVSAAANTRLLKIHDAIDVLAGAVGDDDVAERVDGSRVTARAARQRHRRRVRRVGRRDAVAATARDLAARRPRWKRG